jgi:hypothetical protein
VKIHKSELPDLPVYAHNVNNHPFKVLIKETKELHLESHRQMGSWSIISAINQRARDQQILGFIWVYTYKTDKYGRFVKIKARLIVRGDQ